MSGFFWIRFDQSVQNGLNLTKSVQDGSRWIKLIIWFKSDKIGPNWFKLVQIVSTWIKLEKSVQI